MVFIISFLFGAALLIWGVGLIARAHLAGLGTALGLFILVSLFLFILTG